MTTSPDASTELQEQRTQQAGSLSEEPQPEVLSSDQPVSSIGAGESAPGSGRARAAANQAARNNSTEFDIPMLGTLKLPAIDELAFLGGVGVLAVVGAIEWPVALVLGTGHTLAANRRSRVVREFGEALEGVTTAI